MKMIQIMLLLLFLAAQCFADPASSGTFPMKQPDGTVLEVRQEGDEWFHILETSDGYILQKDALGFYAYADENGNSSGIYARNAQERSDADRQFLSGVNQNLVYRNLKAAAPAPVVEMPEYNVPRLAKSTIQRLKISTCNLFFLSCYTKSFNKLLDTVGKAIDEIDFSCSSKIGFFD